MLPFTSLPQVRIVRNAGQLVPPPPQPPQAPGVTAARAREVLAVALGLWPLTGVMLLAVGLLVVASNWSSP